MLKNKVMGFHFFGSIKIQWEQDASELPQRSEVKHKADRRNKKLFY